MTTKKAASFIKDVGVRRLLAEFAGTFFLVFFAVGVATLSFGFNVTGASKSAGVVATALAFGLVLMALVYVMGPISGCHVNPAVTLGFLVAGRISIMETIGYWIAQILGGLFGALVLWGVVAGARGYSTRTVGLGTDGYGAHSLVHLDTGAAFVAEAILTLLFVYVILVVTSKVGNPGMAGLIIGFTLTLVHLMGIPLTGTSVNPARSLGPAVVVGGAALSQVWLFLIAPMIGGGLAAGLFKVFMHERAEASETHVIAETPQDAV